MSFKPHQGLRSLAIALSTLALAACGGAQGGGDIAEWSGTATIYDTDPGAQSERLALLARMLLVSQSGIDDLETFAPIALSLDLSYSELDFYRSPLDFVFREDPGEGVRELVFLAGEEERRFAVDPVDLSGTPPGLARPGAVFSWDFDAECGGERPCELNAAGEAFGSAVGLLAWLEAAGEVQVLAGDRRIAFTVPQRPGDVAGLIDAMAIPREPDFDAWALYQQLAGGLDVEARRDSTLMYGGSFRFFGARQMTQAEMRASQID